MNINSIQMCELKLEEPIHYSHNQYVLAKKHLEVMQAIRCAESCM